MDAQILSGQTAKQHAVQGRSARHYGPSRYLSYGNFRSEPSGDLPFWNKLFPVGPDRTATYRAAAEAGLAASLVLFLYTFLRIGLWHVWIKTVFWVWIAVQFGLIVVAIVDPQTAAGVARISTVLIAGVGTLLIAYFALRGQDRAMSLIPSWMLLIVWLLGASMIVAGKLSGEIVVSSLVAGLVLILVLLGFTVTQFAFHTGGSSVSQVLCK